MFNTSSTNMTKIIQLRKFYLFVLIVPLLLTLAGCSKNHDQRLIGTYSRSPDSTTFAVISEGKEDHQYEITPYFGLISDWPSFSFTSSNDLVLKDKYGDPKGSYNPDSQKLTIDFVDKSSELYKKYSPTNSENVDTSYKYQKISDNPMTKKELRNYVISRSKEQVTDPNYIDKNAKLYSINFKNPFPGSQKFAILYFDTSVKKWCVEGWFNLKPKETIVLTRYFNAIKGSRKTEQFIFISSNRMNERFTDTEKYIAQNDFKYFEPWPYFEDSPIEKPTIKGQEVQKAKFLPILIEDHIEMNGTGNN